MSSVSSAASSSKFRSIISASFNRRFCRSAGLNLLQGPLKARRAAATARSMSSLSPSATVASTSPVDGLMLSNVFARGGLDPFAVDQHALGLALQKRMAGGENIYDHGFSPCLIHRCWAKGSADA